MVVRIVEVEKNFFTPRDYQIELLHKACEKNIIVPLGTGCGKTFIAVLLIKEMTAQLASPFHKGGKRVFFLVDKVSLVHQQASHIELHTTLNVGEMHGNLNGDVWSNNSKFNEFIEKNEVVVLTAQIFVYLIDHQFMNFNKIALLIFDECHHALGSRHAFRIILHRYGLLPKDNRPKVLGLTASLINNKIPPPRLEAVLQKLEKVLHCSIETASDLVAISKYGAKPTEYIIKCQNFHYKASKQNREVLSNLEAMRMFCIKSQEFHPDFDIDPRKPVLEAVNRIIAVLKQLGPWCAWKVCQLFQRQLKKHCNQRFLPPKQVLFLQAGLTTVKRSKRILDPKVAGVKSFMALKPLLPERLIQLFDILESYNPSNKQLDASDAAFCGIVFVEQRYVAYVMNTLIKAVSKWDKERFGHISSDFMIGYSSNLNLKSEEIQSLHKRQEEVLKKFRHRQLNLLIATSVLEEGIDVRQCNAVIRFDRPVEFRGYVQSKGRTRKDGSKYYILVENSDYKQCINDLRDFKEIEAMLIKRCHNAHNPLITESLLADDVDNLVPPYVVKSTGAMVTLTSAITLVNRYCTKLPSDIFTRLVPHNKIIPCMVNGEKMYTAELLLPINSPIKQPIVVEEPLPTKKLAQMAVALETCRVLHQKKDLNDNLMPVGKDMITLNELDDDPDEFVPNMNYKVGSARRRQLYDKRMAKALHGTMPSDGEECFIYVMEINLIKAVSANANPKNRKIINPVDTQFCFGFLSKKCLPSIPSFPVFLRQGKMEVNVFPIKSRLRVDAEMLHLLKVFHHYIFDNVLRLVKGGLVFVPEKAAAGILIVPLRRDRSLESDDVEYNLNYAYVRNVVSLFDEMPRVPSEEERQKFKFDPAQFQDAVVMPWYRDNEHPSFYYVAEVVDAKPSSKFPDDKFGSFNDYFIQKYNITIYDQDQPLLDVDYTSSRLNLLMPRHWQRSKNRVSNVDGKINEPSSQGQILVPELVDIHPIAASLWNLISALPTMLYRINCLLLADELRDIILREAMEIDTKPPDDHHWPPLDYPTAMDDVEKKSVQKICDLKREYDEKIAQQKQDGLLVETAKVDFEIGVWDPELANELENISLNPVIGENRQGLYDVDMETMGLVANNSELSHHGDMSDDDADDAVVLFDFVNSVHEKLGKDNEKLFAPRENIKSAGWDSLVVIEESVPNGVNMPLSVNSGIAEIDSRALMADLLNMSWGLDNRLNFIEPILPPAPNNLAGGTPAKKEPTEKVDEKRNSAPERKQPIQLYLDSLERLEDSDRISNNYGREEEWVDLIDFDDEKDWEFSGETSGCTESQRAVDLLDITPETELNAEVLSPLKIATHINSDQTCSFEKGDCIRKISSDWELFLPSFDEMNQDSSSFSCLDQIETEKDERIMAPELDWMTFSFEEDTLHFDTLITSHPYGVSPCTLLQAMTLSCAADGCNLERLETVGDSFLKFAVTDYLFHKNPDQHEGRLSFARSKEVSNCNLYRLGKKHGLPSLMIGSKFDPNDAWLPPCYAPTSDFKAPNSLDAEERDKYMESILEGKTIVEQTQMKVRTGWDEVDEDNQARKVADGVETIDFPKSGASNWDGNNELTPLPYNMLTQQTLSDKSIADAVEALIGAHLIELGPSATLKFMNWLGLKVLNESVRPESPLLRFLDTPEDDNKSMKSLNHFWLQFQFSKLEERIGYRFKQKAYLLQAFTHASYYKNRITGCYQRLEFLGDAVLDYLITRFLFQHPSSYSPGVLTDLRSALVNNTIFASLAVKYSFHKHFVAMCAGLYHMIEKFVQLCNDKNLSGANFNAEMYMVTTEEEIDEGEEEDIEVPKAMGDIFESLAGAIYLDSGRSLDVVWRIFYNLMKDTINECCSNPPKSPIRELLELEPDRARFSKLERILETGKVRVTVDIQGKCRFTGMGRSYRIAKCTAAKRALKYLRGLQKEKEKAAVKA